MSEKLKKFLEQLIIGSLRKHLEPIIDQKIIIEKQDIKIKELEEINKNVNKAYTDKCKECTELDDKLYDFENP